MMFSISATAGDTTIDAVSSECELRKMGAAIAGDYRAIGNSLMIEGTGHNPNPHGIRYQALTSSSTSITDIPAHPDEVGAYLYWSGWIAQPVTTRSLQTHALISITGVAVLTTAAIVEYRHPMAISAAPGIPLLVGMMLIKQLRTIPLI